MYENLRWVDLEEVDRFRRWAGMDGVSDPVHQVAFNRRLDWAHLADEVGNVQLRVFVDPSVKEYLQDGLAAVLQVLGGFEAVSPLSFEIVTSTEKAEVTITSGESPIANGYGVARYGVEEGGNFYDGVLTHVDIEIFENNMISQEQFLGTLAHEIGHAVGLDHPYYRAGLTDAQWEESSLMSWAGPDGTRTPQPKAADVVALELIYGEPATRDTIYEFSSIDGRRVYSYDPFHGLAVEGSFSESVDLEDAVVVREEGNIALAEAVDEVPDCDTIILDFTAGTVARLWDTTTGGHAYLPVGTDGTVVGLQEGQKIEGFFSYTDLEQGVVNLLVLEGIGGTDLLVAGTEEAEYLLADQPIEGVEVRPLVENSPFLSSSDLDHLVA
jgi:hypothetical protein